MVGERRVDSFAGGFRAIDIAEAESSNGPVRGNTPRPRYVHVHDFLEALNGATFDVRNGKQNVSVAFEGR